MNFKKLLKLIFNKIFIQKMIAYFMLIVFCLVFQDFLFVFFLTFIFAYLFLTFWWFIHKKITLFLPKILRDKKQVRIVEKFFSLNIIIIFLYLWFIGMVFFALSDLLPQIVKELKDVTRYVPALSEQVTSIANKLEEIKNFNAQLGWTFTDIISKQDLDLLTQVYERLKTAWIIFVKVMLSLILSYIFIIDRDKLSEYLKWIQSSNFRFFYDEYKIIFEKIVRTFGLVFQAQSIIALTNAFLTTVGLMVIWAIHWMQFPFIYTLAIVVFICGFIPVLGTFISSFPILLIGFTMVDGMTAVIEIVFLITLIHAIEAYYLNPKIVSSFVRIPVSLTFLILIVSEHFMWFAGLVIGISSFYLLMELLRDADNLISKSKHTLSEMSDVQQATKEKLKNDIRMSRKI